MDALGEIPPQPPTGMIDETQTKNKLGKIMNYFDTFDEGMTYKTRVRQAKTVSFNQQLIYPLNRNVGTKMSLGSWP